LLQAQFGMTTGSDIPTVADRDQGAKTLKLTSVPALCALFNILPAQVGQARPDMPTWTLASDFTIEPQRVP